MKTSQAITGSIILSKPKSSGLNFLVFRTGSHPLISNEKYIAEKTTLSQFRRFAIYCQDLNIMQGAQAKCNFETINTLYAEFQEVYFNEGMERILAQNNIEPSAPAIKALITLGAQCGNNAPNSSWLMKTRGWLQMQLARVSFQTREPRQAPI